MTNDAQASHVPLQDSEPAGEVEKPGYGPDSLLGDVLDDPQGRPLIERALPAIVNAPLILQLRHSPLGQVVGFGGQHLSAEDLSRIICMRCSSDPAFLSAFSRYQKNWIC